MNNIDRNRFKFATTDPNSVDVAVFALDEETRSVLQQGLSDFNFRNLRIEPGDVRTATKIYKKTKSPNLLIVDISNSELPLSEIQELANVCAPTVQVIVVGTIDTVGLYRSLIHQGVSDYLVKPLSKNLFSGVFKKILTPDEPLGAVSATGKTIGIYGVSGGVGATCLTGALGDILSRELHRKIMLIDLNLHKGDLGLQFDKNGEKGLTELLVSPERMDDVFLERTSTSIGSRLDLLNSDDDWNSEVKILPSAIENLLGHLRQHYHFTILDIMPQPSHYSLEIFASTDIRILMLSPSLAALRNSKKILNYLSLKQSRASTLVVLSHTRPMNNQFLSVEKIEKYIGRTIDYQFPFDGRNVAKAMAHGGPLSHHKGKIVTEMRGLAKSLLGQRNIQRGRFIWKKFVVRRRDVWSKNT